MTHPFLPILIAHGDAAFLQAFHEVRLRQLNHLYSILSTVWNDYNRSEPLDTSKISLRLWMAQTIHTIDSGLDITVFY